jgi:hypothetical protein
VWFGVGRQLDHDHQRDVDIQRGQPIDDGARNRNE